MPFEREELEFHTVENSGLHDYLLETISVDYGRGFVTMELKTPRGADCMLRIGKFRRLYISRTAPWGPGSYILASDVEKSEADGYTLTMQLNSGDEIMVEVQEAL